MFDLTSGKLLLLGIVALIVVGPKDLPVLLRTIGKYVGMIKRQADEFREQFNEALRESEFEQLKKDVEHIGEEAQSSMRDAEEFVRSEFDAAKDDLERVGQEPEPATPLDRSALPEVDHAQIASASESTTSGTVNGASHPAEPEKHSSEAPKAGP